MAIVSKKYSSAMRQLSASFRRLNAALLQSARATTQYAEEYRRTVINLYLLSHDRLPGSTRTKRLRKKRMSVLSRWDFLQIKRHQ